MKIVDWLYAFASIIWNGLRIIVGCLSPLLFILVWVQPVALFLCKIILLPWDIFNQCSEDRTVNFSKHAHGQAKAGGAILDLFFLPYNLFKESFECITGGSEFEEDVLRFWFTFGWVSIVLAFVSVFLWHLF